MIASVGVGLASASSHGPVEVQPLFDDTHGDHLVAHVRTEHPNGAATVLLAAEDPDGDLVAYIFVLNNRLWASDGASSGTGDAVLLIEHVGTQWMRLDLWAHGSSYDVSVNLETWSTGLASTTPTLDIRWRPDPTGILDSSQDHVHVDRVRADVGGDQDHTFTTPLAQRGWSAVIADGGPSLTGSPEVERRHGYGYQGHGSVDIRGSGGIGGLAYIQTDVSAHDGVYVAETSVRTHVLPPPDHQAVVAGISGSDQDPTVHWAVTLGAVPELGAYQFFYQAPDGSHTPIGPVWYKTAWHTVRATVFEDQGLLQVQIDGGDTALEFTGQALGSSQRIAVGDIQTGVLRSGQFLASYDDVSIVPFQGFPP